MVRSSAWAWTPFWQRRQPIDFVSGYNNFVNRTVSRVVTESTPIIAEKVTPIITNSILQTFLTFQTDYERGQRTGKGGGINIAGATGFNIGGVALAYGQGLANVGGQYVITNEAGRGGSTAAAKSILASYNAYRGR